MRVSISVAAVVVVVVVVAVFVIMIVVASELFESAHSCCFLFSCWLTLLMIFGHTIVATLMEIGGGGGGESLNNFNISQP